MIRPLSARMPVSGYHLLRPLATIFILSAVLLALLPATARAIEQKAFGDVVVRAGEEVEEVSTTFGDVVVEGSVQEGAETGFGSVRINGPVGGDVRSGSGDVEIAAPVEGDVEAGFGSVYVNSRVGGDVDVGHGDVALGPEALIVGNVYCGSGEISESPGALVAGNQMVGMASGLDQTSDGPGVFGFAGWLLAALGFAACCVLLAVLAPRPLSASARALEGSPVWSLLVGVASVPAVFVVAIALAVSIVGIPVLLLLAPAYLALLFFGALVAAYFVGRRLLLATGRHRGGEALAALVGALIVAAAYQIPIFGNLLLYALVLLGTGAAVLALLSRRRRPTYPSSYEDYARDRRDT